MPTNEIDKILSCIGKEVNYKFPGGEKSQHGILKDRSVFKSPYGGPVPYWDVVDLIEFRGEKEPECIRIGYYRKPGEILNWGSQTTITETKSGWRGLLVKATREKEWFRKLLDEVMDELQKPATH
jgi:hypothetical protein